MLLIQRSSACLLLALIASAPVLAQDPKPSPADLRNELNAAMQAGEWEDVIRTSKELLALQPKDPQATHHLGYALHVQGRLEEAVEVHKKGADLPQFGPVCAYNAACAYALLGKKEDAFTWLQNAIDRGFRQAGQLVADTDLDSLRGDPRFEQIVKSMQERAAGPAPRQVFAQQVPRMSARLAFFAQGGVSPGQLAIDYGPVAWNPQHDEKLEAGALNNMRWRMGSDFWTTLDTNVPITLGGQEIAPGEYYLTLERNDQGQYLLAILEAASVRAEKLDAFMSRKTRGGVEAVMTHEAADPADKLAIQLIPNVTDDTKATLELRYGPHRLTAPVVIHFEEARPPTRGT